MFELAASTIFVTLAGSQAHGTARAGSDVDVRGVCVAPLALRLSLFERFEQQEGELEATLAGLLRPRIESHPTAAAGLTEKLEGVVYDIAKFLKLCASANPHALEILFADERDWLYEAPGWRRLYAKRHQFLTRQVQQTYHGYAMAQLKKIRTHRAWLLEPPKKKPSRADFGLPETSTLGRDEQSRAEQAIAAKLREYGIEDLEMPRGLRLELKERLATFFEEVLACGEEELEARLRAVATHALQLPREVAATLHAERRYRQALRQWQAYQTWKSQRNPERAALEAQYGYDTKHAMHLVRLMRTGLEVLQTGELRVRRPDAEELLAIRDGALSYDELLGEAERLQEQMEAAAQTTTLPADVAPGEVDALLFEWATATETPGDAQKQLQRPR